MDSISCRSQSTIKSEPFFFKHSVIYWLRAFNYLWLIIFVLLATGCTAFEGNNEPSETIKTPEPTASKVISVTESPLPAMTHIVAVTSSTPEIIASARPTQTDIPPTTTPAPSHTPAPLTHSAPTITSVPTLSTEQEGIFLSMLMNSNSGCSLPCWWGVTPGQTETQTARDMFASQGIDNWSVSFDDASASMGLGYFRQDDPSFRTHDVTVEFNITNNIIEFVDVHGGHPGEDLHSLFAQDWRPYSLAEMLNHYGVPSYVEIVKIGNSPYYRLEISYAADGIEIGYIIQPTIFNDQQLVCSDFHQIDSIHLTLYPPEQVSDIPRIIPNRLDDYSSWESVIGSDLETFYEAFRHLDSPACVEVTQ